MGTRLLQVKKVELLHYCQMGHKSRLPSRSLLTLRWGRDTGHCWSEGGEEGEFHTGWEEQECLTTASHGASTDHMESIGWESPYYCCWGETHRISMSLPGTPQLRSPLYHPAPGSLSTWPSLRPTSPEVRGSRQPQEGGSLGSSLGPCRHGGNRPQVTLWHLAGAEWVLSTSSCLTGLPRRTAFCGAFCLRPLGISRLLASSAPSLGSTRQNKNPGKGPLCHSSGPAVPGRPALFSPPFRVFLLCFIATVQGLVALSRRNIERISTPSCPKQKFLHVLFLVEFILFFCFL